MVSTPAPARIISFSCLAAWIVAAETLVERTTRIPTSATAAGSVSAERSLRTSTWRSSFSSSVTVLPESLLTIRTFMFHLVSVLPFQASRLAGSGGAGESALPDDGCYAHASVGMAPGLRTTRRVRDTDGADCADRTPPNGWRVRAVPGGNLPSRSLAGSDCGSFWPAKPLPARLKLVLSIGEMTIHSRRGARHAHL